jgi:hypothetical protein
MPIPNGGLITETNRQYYAGAQQFYIDTAGAGQTFTSTFNTDLVFGSSDPLNNNYILNNFKIYTSSDALNWLELTPSAANANTTVVAPIAGLAVLNPVETNQTMTILVANDNVVPGMLIQNTAGNVTYGTVVSVVDNKNFIVNIVVSIPAANPGTNLSLKSASPWSVVGNIVTVSSYLALGTYLKIQMNKSAVEDNYGGYEYTRLVDAIDNFLIAYVGPGKLIPSVKRSDVIFHAKRGLQEFSYDTLRSIKSQELTVNSALSVIIPQDYVNYTRLSWIDEMGVQHTIFPANTLTTNPYENPVQDDAGVPTQDSKDSNITGTSQTDAAWAANNPRKISGAFLNEYDNANLLYNSLYDTALGQRYGLNPPTSQKNGWFTINEREGKFSFSSDLAEKLITLEYISDGNAYDLDVRIPKLAEEALYAHILYAIISVTRGIQEYIVKRFQKEKSAKLRNAKIRLSNLKSDQLIQVMRGKSKWLKF